MTQRDGTTPLAISLPTITVTSLFGVPVAAGDAPAGGSGTTTALRKDGGNACARDAPANVTLECSWISVAV